MKEGNESDILMPQNESDCVSENLDFENFPGEHAPGPRRGAKKIWFAALWLTKILHNL